jgi:hypothetical protein
MEDWTGLAFPTLPCLGWLEPVIQPQQRAATAPPASESGQALPATSDERPTRQPAVS